MGIKIIFPAEFNTPQEGAGFIIPNLKSSA